MDLDFKKLMGSRFLIVLALEIQAITLGWQMYVQTKDPLFLGLVGLAEAVPALGLALYAGYVVDRSRPLVIFRRLLYVCLASSAVFLWSQLEQDRFSHNGQVACLFCVSFLTGLARSFAQPSIYAAVPRMLARDKLSMASAWMSSSLQIARISGPALGGLLFGYIGVVGTVSFVAVLYVLAIIALLLMKQELAALPRPDKPTHVREELLSGVRFVFKHPVLLPALSLDMVSVLFGGVTALLPIYAAEILFVGAKGLGILRAAPAVGAVVLSLWLTRFEIRKRAGTWLFVSVGGFGLCIVVFAVSRNYWLSLIALCLSGAFDSVSMVIRTAVVQLTSPSAMRGKISAVNSIFIGSSNELGEFESGVAARFLGVVPAALVGGIICLITVGLTAVLSPTLRNLDLEALRDTQPT